MATLEELTAQKNELKLKVKELKAANAAEEEIAPVYDRYVSISNRVQKLKDAGLEKEVEASPATPKNTASGGGSEDFITRLSAEKDMLKKEVKDLKDKGASDAEIQKVYDRYVLVRGWLSDPSTIPESERGSGDASTTAATPVPQRSASRKDLSSSMTRQASRRFETARVLSEAELLEEKKSIKAEIKVAKNEGRSADSIQPLYDRYLFLNEALADYATYTQKVQSGAFKQEAEVEYEEEEVSKPRKKTNVDYAAAEEADVDTPTRPPPPAADPASVNVKPANAVEIAPPQPAIEQTTLPTEPATQPVFADGAVSISSIIQGDTTEADVYDAIAGNFETSGDSDVDPDEVRHEGILESEGGALVKSWKKRYATLTSVEFAVRKEKTNSGPYKMRIDLTSGATARLRKANNQIEVRSGENLSTVNVLQADAPETAKKWARAIQNTVVELEANLKKTLTFKDPPMGFDGKVFHLGWVEVADLALNPPQWEWRFLTLSDFCINLGGRVPTPLSLSQGVAGVTGELLGSLARKDALDPDVFYLDIGGRTVEVPLCFAVKTGSVQQRDAWLTWIHGLSRQALHILTRDPITFHGVVQQTRVSLVVTRNKIALYPLLCEGAVEAIPDSTSLPMWQYMLSDLKEYRPREDGKGVQLTFVGDEKNVELSLHTDQYVSIINVIYQVSEEDQRLSRMRFENRRTRIEQDPRLRNFLL